MTAINITTDATRALRKMEGFNRQLPYAAALTLNATAESIQSYLREVTYKRAWQNRNAALPKALTLFRNADRANKRKLHAKIGPARRMSKHGDHQFAGEGFTGRQKSGRTKTAKGSAIAIPQIKPGLRRLKGGGISKAKRPRNNPKLFKIKARRGRELLVERQRKKLVTRYVLTKTARGTRRLSRFDRDVQMVVQLHAGSHFERAISRAFATAR